MPLRRALGSASRSTALARNPVARLLADVRRRLKTAELAIATLESDITRQRQQAPAAETAESQAKLSKFSEILEAHRVDRTRAAAELEELESTPRWKLEEMAANKSVASEKPIDAEASQNPGAQHKSDLRLTDDYAAEGRRDALRAGDELSELEPVGKSAAPATVKPANGKDAAPGPARRGPG
jgi:hypothetical protein